MDTKHTKRLYKISKLGKRMLLRIILIIMATKHPFTTFKVILLLVKKNLKNSESMKQK